MLRVLLALTTGSAVFAVVYAQAAGLGVASASLAAGDASVLACDQDGVSITYAVVFDSGPDNRWEVTSVTVGGISAACNGGLLYMVAVNGSGTALASAGPVTVSATSAVVDLTPDPPAAALTGVHLVIVGP
ncbi:MAG: hypothetical protein GEU75_01785 [Dehalococcoidia bacterium]|nr:hypothetical protein [Dehalococcoidia bacterium]